MGNDPSWGIWGISVPGCDGIVEPGVVCIKNICIYIIKYSIVEKKTFQFTLTIVPDGAPILMRTWCIRPGGPGGW